MEEGNFQYVQLMLVQAMEKLQHAAELLRSVDTPPSDVTMRAEIELTRSIESANSARKLLRKA